MATLSAKKATASFALGLLLAWACACDTPRPGLDEQDWLLYQQRFLSPEGRIVDTGNGNVSHSEGQGFGLLLAVAYHDRQAFDRLWSWTTSHLQIRHDKLFAWRWSPDAETGAINDVNNASDGDLLIAWALCRAEQLWAEPAYGAAAAAITRDIRDQLLRQQGSRVYLLPGAHGFDTPAGMTVNLSYWIFPAFAKLQHIDPSPIWEQLAVSGLELLRTARFGRWQLPPDWLTLPNPPTASTVAKDFPPVFGYNAIRIPLYLLWAKREERQLLQPFLDFWTYFHGAAFTPAWTNLLDNSVDSYDASAGIHAVVTLVEAAVATSSPRPPQLPPLDSQQDYYSASLLLLTKVAITERSWP
jgi:endoglucanase